MTGFIFKSTSVVMKFLEKLFDSNLKISDEHNIPNTPVIFVANHFTRAETFILPYMMDRLLKRRVRSLADKKVFVGALGKYLASMGTIATDDKQRNAKIIGDLLTGNADWLIYPEGIMVKNKHVIKKGYYQISMPNGSMLKVKTGAAVLAIKAELIKREIFALAELNQQQAIKNIREKYFISDKAKISPKNIHIVPVTINYFPIRPGNNSIHTISKKFLKNMSGRISEELEIEGNIITNAEVEVRFGQAINIYEYIKTKRKLIDKLPLVNKDIKNNFLINFYRYRLTNKFMEIIYNNVQLNMDHIFACALYYAHKDIIERSVLKNLIYVNAKDIRKLDYFSLHKSIDQDLTMIFMAEENIYYDSILALAIEQKIITKEHGRYFINQEKYNEIADFHQSRLSNTLKIFVNQLVKFPELTKIFKINGKLNTDGLQKKTFDLILRSDEKEFSDDYQTYFSASESKNREFGKPYFLENKNSEIGIILSHGYKSAPEEVKNLAKYLYDCGFNIYVVRLKGHGTAPLNLKYTKWEDWYQSYFKGYAALKQKCKYIVAAGFSTGGLLALLLAARKQHRVDAVLSINAAIKLNDIRVNLVPTVDFWNELLTKFNTNKGKKEFIIDEPENPEINYSKNYLKAIKELAQLMKECNRNLKNITAPTLIIQGNNDPVVNPKSGKIILAKISSNVKKLIEPDFANHVIIKERNKELFSHIANFIKQNIQDKQVKENAEN